jgi:hypothetical protein
MKTKEPTNPPKRVKQVRPPRADAGVEYPLLKRFLYLVIFTLIVAATVPVFFFTGVSMGLLSRTLELTAGDGSKVYLRRAISGKAGSYQAVMVNTSDPMRQRPIAGDDYFLETRRPVYFAFRNDTLYLHAFGHFSAPDDFKSVVAVVQTPIPESEAGRYAEEHEKLGLKKF